MNITGFERINISCLF